MAAVDTRAFTLQDDQTAAIQSLIDASGGGASARLVANFLANGNNLVVPGDGLSQTNVPLNPDDDPRGNLVVRSGFTWSAGDDGWLNDEGGLYLITVGVTISTLGNSDASAWKSFVWETTYGDFQVTHKVVAGQISAEFQDTLMATIPAGEAFGILLTWHGDQNSEISNAYMIVHKLGPETV